VVASSGDWKSAWNFHRFAVNSDENRVAKEGVEVLKSSERRSEKRSENNRDIAVAFQ
jgi:hypothetical protein